MRHRHAIVIAAAAFALVCGGVAAASSLSGSSAPPAARPGTAPAAAPRAGAARMHPSGAVRARHRAVAAARVVRRAEGTGRLVALTFDDGDPVWWRRVLRTLRARDVHATFFILGPYVSANPDLARRTVADGHAIGSHGSSHAVMTGETATQIRVELVRSTRPWAAAGVVPAPYLRPPYGMYDRVTRRAAARAGFSRLILWDVDPEDWREPGARVITRRVLRDVRPGSIVLLHLKRQTAWALPGILRGLHARHLRPVTVPELLRAADR